jgi:hypothetical protein
MRSRSDDSAVIRSDHASKRYLARKFNVCIYSYSCDATFYGTPLHTAALNEEQKEQENKGPRTIFLNRNKCICIY